MSIDSSLCSYFSNLAYSNASLNVIQENLNERFGVNSWHVISINGGIDGFQAVAYGKNTNGDDKYDEVVVTYRGSDSILDWSIPDLLIAIGQTPNQKSGAINFYNSIKNSTLVDQNANITLTGHSLGGALAQLVSVNTDVPAITFNAPGMGTQSETTSGNVINYVNMNDFIGCYGEHVGETRYYLPDGMVDGSFKPHSDYFKKQDFSKYITLPSNVTWGINEAFALWGYDVNNEHGIQEFIASGKVTEANLKNAVSIIEEHFGKTSLLSTPFKYKVPISNNTYIIDNELDHILTGATGQDVIYGNGGNDTIFGL